MWGLVKGFLKEGCDGWETAGEVEFVGVVEGEIEKEEKVDCSGGGGGC